MSEELLFVPPPKLKPVKPGTTRRDFLKVSALTALAALADPKFAHADTPCTFSDSQGLPIYWNGWSVASDNPLVPSVSTFSKATPPAVVARDSSHLDVFAIGNDSKVWTRTWTMGSINSSWSTWLPIAGGPFSDKTPPCVVARDSSHLDVFVIGNDNAIWTAEWAGSSWGNWASLGGSFSNTTPPVAVSRSVNSIDLFVLGTDGKVYTNSWNGTSWSGWNQVTGGPFSSLTPPVVVARDANHIDLFAVGNDSRLWWNSWSNGTWGGWYQVPGGTFSNNTAPAVVARDADHIDVFVIGNDSRIWTAELYDGSWGDWVLISDDPSNPNASTFSKTVGLSAAATDSTHVNIYVVGNDSRIWTNVWNAGEWCTWGPVSDNPLIAGVSAFNNVTPPVAVARDSSHVELFAMGNDSRLWRDTWGPASVGVFVPLSTRRICQLTGNYDPQGLSHINNTDNWGFAGTDMGCPVEFNGALYLLFGDAGSDASDPICYTTDSSVGSSGISLSCVLESPTQYRPFTLAGHGILGINATPTGAFSYNGLLYAFIVWGGPNNSGGPYGTLTSASDPSQDFTDWYDISDGTGKFWQIAPVVVSNADVPGLPSSSGDGLLIWGQSYNKIYLAWMPLNAGVNPPPLSSIMYYAGNGNWSTSQGDAALIFSNLNISQVSVSWLPGPGKWLFLYTNAYPYDSTATLNPHQSMMARIGDSPWDWSDEIPIFNPDREGAWGEYMHMPGSDNLYTLSPGASSSTYAYAYSPFCLNRYTQWNATTRVLTIFYLMATFVPYQVQLMTSQIQL